MGGLAWMDIWERDGWEDPDMHSRYGRGSRLSDDIINNRQTFLCIFHGARIYPCWFHDTIEDTIGHLLFDSRGNQACI